ncbi:hypothetical protein DAPK24_013270 [Pichia kluyveri]|uniref:candidapepsin n=1 Tax=Pichia kluyveri TaxID=36015 RepID=A0AAV5R168_PICKL|nr:hypothetical protein DAPK24_013270 [Pichia kluyveri]
MLSLSVLSIFSAFTGVTFASNSEKYWALSAEKVVSNVQIKHHVKRDDTSDYVSLSLIDEQTFYMANVLVGSNKEKVGVLVDTGSSDFWLVSSDNEYCEAGTVKSKGRKIFNDNITDNYQNKASSSSSSAPQIDCSEYGTFNSKKSSSFHSNGTSFSITYADNTFAKGTWGQDTIDFGNIEVENMNIAVCDQTDNAQGVLGIGLGGLEVTSQGSSSPYIYENLPLKLVSDGLINKAAYSVYLDDSSNSEIIFGAVDSSKYTGDLVSLPIVNALYNQNVDSPIQLTVTVNDLKFINEESSQVAEIGSGAIAALLDTGTTLSYFPDSIVNSITSLFDLSYSESLQYYVGACSIADNSILRFNFQGLNLDIPVSSFLITLYTQTNTKSDQCAFGILSSGSEDYMTLGQSFLSSVYMVADLEDLTISLAKGTNSGGSRNIDIINNEIPQAKQPENSSTYGSNNNIFTINSTPAFTSTTLSSSSSSSSASSSSGSSSASSSQSNSSSSASASASASASSSSSASSSASASSSSSTESSSVYSSTQSSSSSSSSSLSPSLSSASLSSASFSSNPRSSSSSTLSSSSSSSTLTTSSSSSSSISVSSISSTSQRNDGVKLLSGFNSLALLFVALL